MRRRDHAQRRETSAQPLDIAAHHRAEIRVHHRGGHPLEFAKFGRHLVRHAGERFGEVLGQDAARGFLVPGADEAIQETNRDRLHAGRTQQPHRGAKCRLVQRDLDAAVRAQPLRHLQPQVARHQHRRLVHLEVI
jgi:hypothetical protein